MPYNDIWKVVCERLDPKIVGKRTPEQLQEVYAGGDCKKWRDWYKPINIGNDITPEQISNAMSSKCLLEIWYRALDRFPGGNADMHTCRFAFLKNESGDASVTLREYSNWDGSHENSECTPPKLRLQARNVMNNIIDSIIQNAPKTGTNSECTGQR